MVYVLGMTLLYLEIRVKVTDFIISDAQMDRYQSQPELFMGDLKGDNEEEQFAEIWADFPNC